MKKELITIGNLGDLVKVHNTNMGWVDKCITKQKVINKKFNFALAMVAVYVVFNNMYQTNQALKIAELERKVDELTNQTVKEGE